jgi:hypothetical protein
MHEKSLKTFSSIRLAMWHPILFEGGKEERQLV